jgi:hypothetical protein
LRLSGKNADIPPEADKKVCGYSRTLMIEDWEMESWSKEMEYADEEK